MLNSTDGSLWGGLFGLVLGRPILLELRKISAIAALFDDDTGTRDDAARILREREGAVHPPACYVRASSIILYVVHIYLIHAFAFATAFTLTGIRARLQSA
jgi:hypothetical protein